MQVECAVEIEQLTKRYRSTPVLNNLTLSIPRGEVVGILGPNGAGKSTLMRLLIGAIRPTSGQITVLDKEIGDRTLLGRIGYLPADCPLQEFLTAVELLSLHASLLCLHGSEATQHISAMLERVSVSGGDYIREMSRGTRQRLGIAMALLNAPDLVILDEPGAALDQSSRMMLRELIQEHVTAGGTVLVSSHMLTEIEHACGRIIMLNHGEIVADGRISELTSFTSRIDVEVTEMNERAMKALEKICVKVEYDPNSTSRISVFVKNKADASKVASALVENGVGLITLEPQMETLEDLFTRLTAG